MNTRLNELFQQAAYKDMPTGVDKIHGAELTKFAELIIKQCIEIANEYDGDKLSRPGMIIGNWIERYFEIEEDTDE